MLEGTHGDEVSVAHAIGDVKDLKIILMILWEGFVRVIGTS
jgi:hypothetical protein